jgi:cobalamin biosynthesis protein CobD/CbiB
MMKKALNLFFAATLAAFFGYLISGALGHPVNWLGWFSMPGMVASQWRR